ncbi:MAG TPA: hypothetical protein VNZ57_14555 [Longimicrobiales bacterium]|nr:hypothetical protein [Longimicrobiales bacterium]
MDEQVLRAKYIDWCSGRVAERFLQLSPDEIYELAQETNPYRPAEPVGGAVSGGEPVATTDAGPLALQAPPARAVYWVMVARVAETLSRELELPSYDAWRVAYLEAPDRYDTELLGFWHNAVWSGGRQQT